MASCPSLSRQQPSIDADKLSYEIFSILESKFLFGYDNRNLFVPKPLPVAVTDRAPPPAVDGIPGGGIPVLETEFPSLKGHLGQVCVLSIDGGGGDGIASGVLAGKALAYLEDALQRLSGNPEARICEFFDVVAGSGIGGILAAMLFATRDGKRPLYRAEDAWKFLAEKSAGSARSTGGPRKFLSSLLGGSARRSAPGMAEERMVKEAFGGSMTLKETLKPVLIPCYDMCSAAPFLFSRADALESDSFDFRISDVCHATSAEPGADKALEMQSVDGKTRVVGVEGSLAGMSNPTAAAITHVLHNKEEFPFVKSVEDLIVVSIGVGPGQPMTGTSEQEDAKNLKGRKWIRPISRIAGDNSAELVDQAVSMAFGQCSSTKYVRIQANSYVRAQDKLSGKKEVVANATKMAVMADEMLKEKNVESVLFGGKRVAEKTNGEKLDWFAGQIVEEHQKRSRRAAPTVAIKRARSPKLPRSA
ncbi:hypothetical protein MLD38_003731 [Melastoma candidum]|uniref:Uncharacterized protein n=1 Tax=Melastoma candidum TaxID=119954 RepID=A0ACB9S5G6_9MYRT|nr:hypothetical protein MLD38_003731 [Melastoma candidum]